MLSWLEVLVYVILANGSLTHQYFALPYNKTTESVQGYTNEFL